MTNEEKEFEKINSEFFDFEDIHYDKIKKGVMQAYLDGQKAGYEQCEKTQPFNDHKCNNCARMTVSQDEYISTKEEQCRDYEEENERLKADLEEAWKHCKAVDDVNAKLRCCGNCKHYPPKTCQYADVCSADYDRWEVKE